MTDPTPPPARRSVPLLVAIGVAVVALGFGLPYLATSPPPNPAPDPKPAAGQAAPPPTPEFGAAFLRLAVGLVVVCGLSVAAARLLNRKSAVAALGAMELLASLPVGSRCTVHLVRAGGRRLLIGTDPTGVKALVELPGAEPQPPPPAAAEAGVVVGPVTVPVAAPGREDVLALLAQLQSPAAPAAPSPG